MTRERLVAVLISVSILGLIAFLATWGPTRTMVPREVCQHLLTMAHTHTDSLIVLTAKVGSLTITCAELVIR